MIDVHLPTLVPKELLEEHPRNSNKQSKHVFAEVRKSIKENGFDESLLVVPRDDGNAGYWIVSGNHRFRAGVAEGMEEFPCVVRKDWDDVQQQLELVRRNYVRGSIDKDAFTTAVNVLAEENALSIDDIRTDMGFEDIEKFLELYREEEEDLNREISKKTTAPSIKMIDDLGLVLSAIFEKYGDTVPNSFIIFPAGNKKHMFIAATPAIIKTLQDIAEYSISNHMDINIALGGILAIGKHNSHLNDIIKEGKNTEGPTEF